MELEIQSMTCGGCASRITKAINSADPAAEVQVDVRAHRVVVQTTQDRSAMVSVLTEAGCPPK